MNYLKIYYSLINKRLNYPPTKNFEKHHIIPISIQNRNIVSELFINFKKGDIVKLSYREHYIAHALLVKIFKKTNDIGAYKKMLNAWHFLNSVNEKTNYIGSKSFQIFKIDWLNNFYYNLHPKKPVVLLDNKGNYISEFDSCTSCADFLKTKKGNVCHVCKNKGLMVQNHICLYLDEWLNIYYNNQKEIDNLLSLIQYRKTKSKGHPSPNKGKKMSKDFCEKLKGPRPNVSGENHSNHKTVLCYDLNNNLIKVYKYLSEVKKDGYNMGIVSDCCNNKYKTKLGNNIYAPKNMEKRKWCFD